jgi:hypothetical protein
MNLSVALADSMAAGAVLRTVTFLLHFASAVFLMVVSFRCSNVLKTQTFTESVTDPVGYAVVMNATCVDPYSRECFYGWPQAYDTVQHGLGWNVFALLAAFEWLSASFALYYLDDIVGQWVANPSEATLAVCLVWNLTGFLTLMPYSMPLTMMQSGVTALSLLAASAGQATARIAAPQSSYGGQQPPGDVARSGNSMIVPRPDEMTRSSQPRAAQRAGITNGDRVILHYTEYCTSASLLFVAVLILFVPDPISWAPLFGFTGIMICNITGIGAHYCKISMENPTPTQWYDLDWTKDGNHFKLFILHSWLALVASMLIIYYLARDSMVSSDVPVWVRFILWNLLVTYTLFGVWATLCYSMADSAKHDGSFDRWMERLDYGLTILSAAAKLPIAYTVFYGLVQEPGGSICKI